MILHRTRSGLSGIWNVMLYSPGVTAAQLKLYEYFLSATCLPPRLVELTALIVAAYERSEYVWEAHAPLARTAGIANDVITAIKDGVKPATLEGREARLYTFLTSLLQHQTVDSADFAAAAEHLDRQSLVEIVALAGQYKTVSMLAVLAALPAPRRT
jgi:4-carboxymuconolactone decarboxylase